MDAFWKGVKATPAPPIPNFSMLESAVAGVVEHVLYQNDLGSPQVLKIAEMLPEARSVTVLRLPYQYFPRKDFRVLLDGIVQSASIRWLHLCCSELLDENTVDAMVQFFRYNETLYILHFAWAKSLEPTLFVNALEQGFSQNQTLVELSLKGAKIGPQGIDAVAKMLEANDSIRILDLERTGLSNTCIHTLCHAIKAKEQLGELNLRNNSIEALGAKTLKSLLCKHATCNLYKVNLALNDLKDAGAFEMAQVLRGNKKLTTLDLRKTRIKNVGMKSLGDALTGGYGNAGNLTIHKLLVEQTASIDPKHLKTIQSALQRNENERIKAFNAEITGSTTSSWNFGKLMVVGPAGSGKSSVVSSLLGGTFVPVHTPTVGIDMQHIKISSREGWKKDKSDNFAESFMAKIKYERHQQGVERRKKSAVRQASLEHGSFLGPRVTYDPAEEKKEMFKNIERQESHFPGFGDKDKLEEEIEAQKKQQAEELEHEYVQASDEENTLRVAIWDYGGNKVLHSVHHLFLSRFGVYLVVFSLAEYKERKERTLAYLRYWLNTIYLHAQSSQILIVGTHAHGYAFDEYQEVCLSVQEITQRMQSIILTADGKTVFALDNEKVKGINALKESVVETFRVQTLVNRVIPLSWVRALDAMNENDRYFLRYLNARNTMIDHGVKEGEVDTALAHFHQLGLLYHFRQTSFLAHKIILEPGWLVEEITRIIRDSKKHPKYDLEEAKRLDLDDDVNRLHNEALATRSLLAYVWHGEEAFMIDLMKTHLLMDDWPWIEGEDDDEEVYFVPALAKSLRKARKHRHPSAVPFSTILGGKPTAVYQLPYLPEGVFQRLVCDCIHQSLSTNMETTGTYPRPVVLKDAMRFNYSTQCTVTLAVDVAVFPKEEVPGNHDVTPQRVWAWVEMDESEGEVEHKMDYFHGVHSMIISSFTRIREEMFAEDFFPREITQAEILELRETYGSQEETHLDVTV